MKTKQHKIKTVQNKSENRNIDNILLEKEMNKESIGMKNHYLE